MEELDRQEMEAQMQDTDADIAEKEFGIGDPKDYQ